MYKCTLLLMVLYLGAFSLTAQDTIDIRSCLTAYMEMPANQKESDTLLTQIKNARDYFIHKDQADEYVSEILDIVKKLYAGGFYTEGICLLEHVNKELAVQKKDFSKKTEIIYQIARGNYFQQKYDLCIELIERNLEKFQNENYNDSLIIADHYNLLGTSLNGKGSFYQAIEWFEKAFHIRERQLGAQHNLVASALNNLGSTQQSLKLFNKATKSYEQALKIREEVLGKTHPTLANVLVNIGTLCNEKGEYNKSLQYYDRAIAIFQENPKAFEARIADIFNNLAVTYKNKGAFQESSSYHQQAIEKYKQLPDNQSEKIATVYNNWANLVELQKDYTKAIELQQQAINLYSTTLETAHPRVVAAKNNQGINYYKNGEYAKALAELQNIVPLIEKNAEQRERFANVCNDLADVYFKLNNLPEAKTYNQKALAIQQDIFGKKSYKLAYTYNSLAQIAEAEGNRDAALQYLQNALAANHADFEAEYVDAAPSPQDFYKYDYFVESLLHKARLLRSGGNQTALLRAKLLYEVADSTLTVVRNELLSAEDKIRLAEKGRELSQGAIANSLQLTALTGDQHYMEIAFQYAEQNKNSVLAQTMAASQAAQIAGIPDSLRTLENQLQSDINYYKQQLAEQPDSLERILYQQELFTAQQDYRTLITKLEKESAKYYQLKYDQQIPPVRAIQLAMPENTALVSYFTGDSVLYSFVINKKDFTVYRSPIGKNFYKQQVGGLRKSIAKELTEDYVELAHTLYTQLFPFTLDENINSLIIIPDGMLSQLPFEALLSKKVNPRGVINFSQLPYLVNDFEVSYSLSARLYYKEQSMTARKQPGEGIIAYAPVFDEPQAVGFFSDGTRNPLAATETTRTLTYDGKYISALPATAHEVEAIAEVFKQKGQKATTYLFKSANEKQLKQSIISQSRYLHIATHGFINEDQPNLSGLLLFPDTTEREDHILYSGEVYNLDLNAQLVVLSACETGLGTVANGEGLLGLSRAFFYAGAENLMVSLWKVQDQATADLMVSFYQEHLNGKSKNFSAPLREAKLNLISTEDFSHPYYWSAFVLIGR